MCSKKSNIEEKRGKRRKIRIEKCEMETIFLKTKTNVV